MKKIIYIIFCVSLILAALLLMYFRVEKFDQALVPSFNFRYWTVQQKVMINQPAGNFNLKLQIPNKKNGSKLIDESYSAKNINILTLTEEGIRKLDISGKNQAKEANAILYNAVLEQGNKDVTLPQKLIDGQRKILLQNLNEKTKSNYEQLIRTLRQSGRDPALLRQSILDCFLGTQCQDSEFKIKNGISEKALAKKVATALHLAGINNLISYGFFPESHQAKKQGFRYWLRTSIKNQQKNLFLDQDTSFSATQVLFWDYLDLSGQTILNETATVEYTLAPLTDYRLKHSVENQERPGFWRYISFDNLPLSEQSVFQRMLLIPIGALIVCVLRVLVGLPTFGTFMAVLIALALLEVGLLSGLVLLVLIVSVALLLRSGLGKFNLLLVPRVSTMLIIVVAIVLGICQLAVLHGYANGLSVQLFPVVILTMLVERISIQIEEGGFRKTLMLFSTTTLAAVIVYYAISNPYLAYWVFYFPELNLLILALIILTGRYTGYRLNEVFRFTAFNR